jgi:hypothetical protein
MDKMNEITASVSQIEKRVRISENQINKIVNEKPAKSGF